MAYETQIVNGHLAIKKVTTAKTLHLVELTLHDDLSLIGLVSADSGRYYALHGVGSVWSVNLPVNPGHGFTIFLKNCGTQDIDTAAGGIGLYKVAPGDSLQLVYGEFNGWFFV